MSDNLRGIDLLLARTRRGLHFWSVAEGVALAILALVLIFWASFALDVVGERMSDMSRDVRLVISSTWWAIVLLVVTWLIVSRLVARISNRSIALLIERRDPGLADRLLTSVELSGRSHDFSSSMVTRAERDAEERLAPFQPRTLLQRGLVIRRWVAALLVAGSIPLFAWKYPAWIQTWGERVVLLEDAGYPRATSLVVRGFDGEVIKVAKGRDAEIVIESQGTTPSRVAINYWIPSNRTSGRQYATRIGDRQFRFVFRSVMEDISFRAVGGDGRTPTRRLQVVEAPLIQAASLVVTPPPYTGLSIKEETLRGAPVSVPVGSSVVINLKTNKPIRQMTFAQGDQSQVMELDEGQEASFTVALSQDQHFKIQVVDVDGIALADPFPIDLLAKRDESPSVSAVPRGVSSAITRMATVPLDLKISDDYAVKSAELETTIDTQGAERRALPITISDPTMMEATFDFDVLPLELKPGQKLAVGVVARDGDDVTGPHERKSESVRFEIVTPEELLSRLATRELMIRQRFEQVIGELVDARASLTQMREQSTGDSPDSQRLFIDRAMAIVRKDAGETASIATLMEEIVDELVNNRVGNSQLIERLKNGVIEPLDGIVSSRYPESIRLLEQLSTGSNGDLLGAAEVALDALIADCRSVLAVMMKLESFNEVVAMLRSIIDDQEQILDETKKARKEKILDLLED